MIPWLVSLAMFCNTMLAGGEVPSDSPADIEAYHEVCAYLGSAR